MPGERVSLRKQHECTHSIQFVPYGLPVPGGGMSRVEKSSLADLLAGRLGESPGSIVRQ